MIKTLLIICLLSIMVGVALVILDINKYVSETGVGIFVTGLVAFFIIAICGVIYKIPFVQTTTYYLADNENIETVAKEHNAETVYINNYSEIRLVHKYSKKDNIDLWIFYTVQPPDPTMPTETTVETEPKVTRETIPTITIPEDED